MAKKEGKEHPRVFISYSHKDEEWMEWVVTHFQVLEKQDMLCAWDDTKIHGGDRQAQKKLEPHITDTYTGVTVSKTRIRVLLETI
ncbi:MAG: hypothetical protein ABSG82_03035 [Sedimentisphaerales bacterium]|jgi:hypothetical protein